MQCWVGLERCLCFMSATWIPNRMLVDDRNTAKIGIHSFNTDPITLPIEEGSITSIYSGYVQCYGSESSLFDCDNIWVDDYACRTDGHEYAGVKCFHGRYDNYNIRLCILYWLLVYALEPECVDGAIQLIENRELEIGYSFVQFCIHGVWVFIGGNSWDDTEAKIVCRKVGFLTLSKHVVYTLY